MIDKLRKLYELLPHGSENAISAYTLSDALEISLNELKQSINDLILDGVLVAHSLNGYYIPTKEDYQNAWEFFQSIKDDDDLHRVYKKLYKDYFGK